MRRRENAYSGRYGSPPQRRWGGRLMRSPNATPLRPEGTRWEYHHITIHLVCAHVHERTLRTRPPTCLEQVERAHRIGVEVVEGDGSRPIVRRLRRRVDDRVGLDLFHKCQNRIA